MVVSDDGALFVIREIDLRTGMTVADVFGRDHSFLMRAELPNFGFMNDRQKITIAFHNGYAYSLQVDGDDEAFLVRYRYALETQAQP